MAAGLPSKALHGPSPYGPMTSVARKAWLPLLAVLLLCLEPGQAMGQSATPVTPQVPGEHQPLLRALNAARADGCNGQRGLATPLKINTQLSAAAERLAGGDAVQGALRAAGYRPRLAGTLFLDGYSGPSGVAQGAVRHSCKALLNPQFVDAGVYQRGLQTWIILAAPFASPQGTAGGHTQASVQASVQAEVLRRVNALRAQGQRCGNEVFAPAAPLALDAALNAAASAHAHDMAQHDYFEHAGRDGSTAADRASRAGYDWRSIGENIAAGQADAATVVAGWLKSPGHCVNLMAPRFRDMGVAFAVNRDSRAGIYWAQVFGTARKP
ncbi:MAG: CAP domain-containing protein [Polaromonas sp.]|nr:CAP domain-containing protein [Polaromonas sp.]